MHQDRLQYSHIFNYIYKNHMGHLDFFLIIIYKCSTTDSIGLQMLNIKYIIILYVHYLKTTNICVCDPRPLNNYVFVTGRGFEIVYSRILYIKRRI